jgi:SAM-dependent methyltransferase
MLRHAAPQAKVTHTVTTERGYSYVGRASPQQKRVRREAALLLSREILNPKLADPDFLVRRSRRDIVTDWFAQLPDRGLTVLDVGGRLQPYRPLLGARAARYIAVDPVFEGLLDVAGVGERLPFRDASFDLVLCTQVLNYAASPAQVVDEIRRVLKPGGTIIVSVPAIFPRLHNQRWRFMPDGLQVLLRDFFGLEIVPEGNSIAGLCRCMNWFFGSFLRGERSRRFVAATLYRAFNLAGLWLDRFSRGRTNFSTNYCCRARKPAPTAAHDRRHSERRASCPHLH